MFVTYACVVFSQSNDYIIKTNNQKIAGIVRSVNLSPNNDQITFEANNELMQTYRPNTLQEWSKDSVVYVSKQHPYRTKKPWVFMKRLTKANTPVVLYEYAKKENQPNAVDLFLERGSTLTKIKPLSFRRQLRTYFADEPIIVALIDKKGVKKKDLLELVEEYNELVQEKHQKKHTDRPPSNEIINRQSFWDFDDLLLSTDEAAQKYMNAIKSAADAFASEVERSIEVDYKIGVSFFQQKKYTAAIPYLKKVRTLILKEKYQLYKAPLIEAMLAQIYYEEEKYQLAIGFNSNALQKWNSANFAAPKPLALYDAYLLQGKIFQKLQPAPSNEIWYQITASEEEKNWKVAFEHRGLASLHPAVNEHKTVDYNLALLSYNTALRLIEQLPSRQRTAKRIDIQLALGLLYFQSGDYPNAELYYEEASSAIKNNYGTRHPQYIEVERRLSEIYLATQLYQEALEYIDQAQHSQMGDDIEINEHLLDNINKIPFPYELLNSIATRGIILYERSKNNPSENELKRVLAHYAIATEMLYQLRNTYRTEGNKSKLGNITHKISQHAVIICNTLFEKTGDVTFLEQAFSYAELSKSAVLFETIQDLKSMQVAGIPREQTTLENGLKVQIAYLKAEVFYEIQQGDEASEERIDALEERIKTTTEKHNALLKEFEQKYPAYYNLKYSNNKAIELNELQRILSPEEVFLEYVATDSFIYTLAITKQP